MFVPHMVLFMCDEHSQTTERNGRPSGSPVSYVEGSDLSPDPETDYCEVCHGLPQFLRAIPEYYPKIYHY